MAFIKIKSFFYFLKKKQSKKEKAQALSEEDIYSLDIYQLKNLLDKNIYFDFFQLDPLSENKDNKLSKYLQKAKLKTKEDILFQLKTVEDLKNPIVLICKTGKTSQVFSRELRDKGFVNVYFIKKGFQSLLEGESA